MGIPSYFSYIIKNYQLLLQPIHSYKNTNSFDNFYLDCNSIIYDSIYTIDFSQLHDMDSQVNSIISCVINKIEEYIYLVKPTNNVFIAFDGVAPVAKLEQQRGRRYKSWYQNEMSRMIFKKDKDDAWNTTAITPGTKFMYELNDIITKHFNEQSFTKYNISNIIVSGSNSVGEGEHKLYEYIRSNPEKHSDQTTIIYGLDADLIMLSINHLNFCPNIYLFRETPHFIQSIDSSLEANANYIMDIPELTKAIISYMNNDREINIKKDINKVYDYVFLCFFLGNDFLPHFPAVNIRTGGVDKMMNAYRATIGNTNEHLTDGKTIYWNNVRKVIEQLANLEEEFIIKEHRVRSSKSKHGIPDTTPEEKLNKFVSIPLYEREMEQYINPLKPYWQTRYYRGLFGIISDTSNEQKKDIAINYLQGLEWTMKYYSTGCPDWRWRYKYNYPPLLQDLIKYIPIFETVFIPNKPANPVSEFVQLCYVLPRTSLSLLPNKLYYELIRRYDHWYKGNCDFVWAYCRYFWESHVEMGEIDINELERFIEIHRHLLT